MGDVIKFTGITKLDIPPDRVLTEAVGNVELVVVVGVDHDGELYFASSTPDCADVIFWMEKAKWELMKIVDNQE